MKKIVIRQSFLIFMMGMYAMAEEKSDGIDLCQVRVEESKIDVKFIAPYDFDFESATLEKVDSHGIKKIVEITRSVLVDLGLSNEDSKSRDVLMIEVKKFGANKKVGYVVFVIFEDPAEQLFNLMEPEGIRVPILIGKEIQKPILKVYPYKVPQE